MPVQHPSSWWCRWNALRGTNGTFISPAQVPVPDLTGKWIIITGSNNGIGLEAAKTFAAAGANLILACREPPAWETHPAAAAEECVELARTNGHTESVVEWWGIDMADLSTVEAFAERWLNTGRALDILCNNAGMSATASERPVLTVDGFEVLHQVNFTSHVLLTLKLLSSLAKAPEPRIICTTSCLHYTGQFDLEHFNGEPGMAGEPYGNNKLYYQTWLTELQHRLLASEKHKHITINGMHPGYVNSGIWNNPRPEIRETGLDRLYRIWKFMAGYLAISPQQGSLAIVYAATSGEFGADAKVQGVGSVGGKGGGGDAAVC
ncbi:uncharacterized protein DSM5745_10317 [Aspergillus mulundensis]|uniref:Uncharacterized protein n=1 Tax=Aspergillus mulundensis TaxID=1810919 RepID=A0A3D8QN07_9EURO|nr:Uncharacterized protein DSM5745_10317 [Aspergillus mulundensis]RDW63206.1 Uncharacterized protein DSM5745_10317 [Aspergillus mulundensis]